MPCKNYLIAKPVSYNEVKVIKMSFAKRYKHFCVIDEALLSLLWHITDSIFSHFINSFHRLPNPFQLYLRMMMQTHQLYFHSGGCLRSKTKALRIA